MGETKSGNQIEIGVIREGLLEEVTFCLELKDEEESAGLRVGIKCVCKGLE